MKDNFVNKKDIHRALWYSIKLMCIIWLFWLCGNEPRHSSNLCLSMNNTCHYKMLISCDSFVIFSVMFDKYFSASDIVLCHFSL